MASMNQSNAGRGASDCYIYGEILGRGAFGVAYAVTHLKSGGKEVMKVIDLSACGERARGYAKSEIEMLQLC